MQASSAAWVVLATAAAQSTSVPAARRAIFIEPTGADRESLFVADSASGGVWAFTVEQGGELAVVAGSPFPAGAARLAISEEGDALFAVAGTSTSGTVRALRVQRSGALAPLPGPPQSIPDQPMGICSVRRGGGEYLYVATLLGRTYAFDVTDAAGGRPIVALPASPFPTSGLMVFGDVAATPDGSFLYECFYSGGLRGFEIAADGALSELPGSPFTIQTRLASVAISPDGRDLYLASDTDPTVQGSAVKGWRIQPDGALVPMPGPAFLASTFHPDSPAGMAIDPDGGRVFVVHSVSDTIASLARDTDGSLALVPGGVFVIGPHVRAVACDGSHAFATDESAPPTDPDAKGVYSFDVLPPGTFAVNAGSPFQAGTTPFDLALWMPGTTGP